MVPIIADFPVILLSGLSGAGKSTALNAFEDMQFFTVDGLPPTLLPGMTKLLNRDALPQYKGLVLGMDLRLHESVSECEKAINLLHGQGISARIVFLEANTSVLIARYATTRRPHPLETEGMGLAQAVQQERTRLLPIMDLSEVVIDTSTYSIHDLRRAIQTKAAMLVERGRSFKVHLISFGFKYGLPAETDMMLDLRFLPNPYFDEALRPMSGQDAPVADYVLKAEPGKSFLAKVQDFLMYLLPLYESEGRYRLTLAFGCTGGRHRSVAVTEAMACYLKDNDYSVTIEHRHLDLG